MEPISWGTIIGGVLTLLVGVAGYLRYKRGKREKLGQEEADNLKAQMDRADQLRDPALKLRVDDKGHP